ncbi:YIP1 family protein [Paenibacillus larvae]|uniref:Yip1 domain protein n=3 Tax=Paenibacillus larvae TaxID=1464 RepID=A0A6C0QV26_9BACL|nr:YIP1 family protein [Paenibacillus larvae]AQR77044.1 hypothetical protein BXP28_06415 [Paenibacillus larvae subsp. larvae]AVF22023.1 Yip1 domain protein [Paenibacillus larvae subsp. larvae]ETK27146.1 hypothetical protein ERIC1_1c05880 [Paenibacillus larvae subsp. larvae DSM 25719]MCY7477882.1 YIP1 family protein [Paenibacillus larvae]MCY7488666.1 YIP1 family protein [Paenibacillus larvae]
MENRTIAFKDHGYILFNPRLVMEKIKCCQNSLKPLFFVTLLSVLFTTVPIVFFDADQLQMMLGVDLSDPNLYTALKTLMIILLIVISFLGPTVWTVINAGIYTVALRVMKIRVSFRQMFLVGLFCYIPMLLNTMTTAIGGWITNGQIKGSPANLEHLFYFVSDPLTIKFLSSFNLFGIWSAVLWGIGIYFLSPKETRRRGVFTLGFIWFCTTISIPALQLLLV